MTTDALSVENKRIPWWLILLQGIALVILGILLLTAPGATLLILVQFLGIWWLVQGLFQIISIFIDSSLWGWKLFAGILGIVAGIVMLQHPLWSAILVPAIAIIILGIQALIFGVVEMIQAFQGGGWGIGLLGVLSIIFGIVLLAHPLIGVAVLPFVLGGFGLVGGIVAIVAAFTSR
jgi:uncharacterized membrane protein HdeD (DUF308 family)